MINILAWITERASAKLIICPELFSTIGSILKFDKKVPGENKFSRLTVWSEVEDKFHANANTCFLKYLEFFLFICYIMVYNFHHPII